MMFSSKPPYNDDPYPTYPRPHPFYNRRQHNPTNPILESFREDDKDAEYWLTVVDHPAYIYTVAGLHAVVDHARRVLTRLANLTR